MAEKFTVSGPQNKSIQLSLDLASSKSESNRALIMNALSGNTIPLQNLANARDTETMTRLLSQLSSPEWDVLDAGTTMRFTTAFAAVKGLNKVMTGTQRMKERPIGILVNALRTLGVEIEYLGVEGYPPHHIKGFKKQLTNHLQIRGDVSSQYISALLMIAPSLPEGLTLELTGKVGSKPYIQMTINLMKHFGVSADWKENIITIAPQQYTHQAYTIEGDWSGASYWYSIAALADNAEIELIGLRKNSNQGDSVLTELMTNLGVSTEFKENSVILRNTGKCNDFEWDFTHCPDIAQTIAVIVAQKGVSAKFHGLESLRIKETDRIDAIKNELAKFGTEVTVIGDESIEILNPKFNISPNIEIETYHDHRMAMAFAPLGLIAPIIIKDPSVVNKSYPDYWRDLTNAGFTIAE
jgi:3-phosphoshikimate 1-carboxyvinyltransferase